MSDYENLKMWYEEYLDKNPYIRAMMPKVYMMRLAKNEKYVLTDQACIIPERREWELFKALVDDFYNNVTDKEIEEFNDDIVNRRHKENREQTPPKKERRKQKGVVYFIKADNGLTKIGRAKNLKQRLDHFTTKLPYKLELVHHIETGDTVPLEEHFHLLFEEKRKRGEWFALTNEDIQMIKSGELH